MLGHFAARQTLPSRQKCPTIGHRVCPYPGQLSASSSLLAPINQHKHTISQNLCFTTPFGLMAAIDGKHNTPFRHQTYKEAIMGTGQLTGANNFNQVNAYKKSSLAMLDSSGKIAKEDLDSLASPGEITQADVAALIEKGMVSAQHNPDRSNVVVAQAAVDTDNAILKQAGYRSNRKMRPIAEQVSTRKVPVQPYYNGTIDGRVSGGSVRQLKRDLQTWLRSDAGQKAIKEWNEQHPNNQFKGDLANHGRFDPKTSLAVMIFQKTYRNGASFLPDRGQTNQYELDTTGRADKTTQIVLKHAMKQDQPKTPSPADLMQFFQQSTNNTGKLDAAGAKMLIKFINTKMHPPLTEQQKADMEQALGFLKDGLTNATEAGPKLATLLKQATSGKLRQVLSQGSHLHQTAIAAMVASPGNTDQIINLLKNADFQSFGKAQHGACGHHIQRALLFAASQGKDVTALMNQAGFKKLPMHEKREVAKKLAMLPSFKASHFPTIQASCTKLCALLKDCPTASTQKEALARKIAKELHDNPASFQHLPPAMQTLAAKMMLEQLGKIDPSKSDHTYTTGAMKKLKAGSPKLYKAVFGTVAKHLKQSGTFGTKAVLDELVGKLPDLTSTLAGKMGVPVGMLVGVAVGQSTADKLTNFFANGVTGGLGMAVGLGVSGAAGAAIGLVPGVLVGAWNLYCNHSVAQTQQKNLTKHLSKSDISPE